MSFNDSAIAMLKTYFCRSVSHLKLTFILNYYIDPFFLSTSLKAMHSKHLIKNQECCFCFSGVISMNKSFSIAHRSIMNVRCGESVVVLAPCVNSD